MPLEAEPGGVKNVAVARGIEIFVCDFSESDLRGSGVNEHGAEEALLGFVVVVRGGFEVHAGKTIIRFFQIGK